MTWFTILLALAALGGSPSAAARKQCAKAAVTAHQKQQCKSAAKKKKHKPVAKVKPRSGTQPSTPGSQRDPGAPTSPGSGGADQPSPTPTPTPKPGTTPTPTPVPTATPDPVKYPARTGVDLSEWTIRPTYRTLATGRVVFNAANLGEDDHNLSVRSGSTDYGKVDLAPGDTESLVLQLPPGTYTLYCSLLGHEEQGMHADISVR